MAREVSDKMTRIIPNKELEKYIQATGWKPGQEVPIINPTITPSVAQSMINIDDILKGETFYSVKNKDGNHIGVSVALQEALDFAGTNGYVATMPELITAKLKAEKSHDFWQNWYCVHTEENIGIDTKGRFYTANQPVLVLVNGGGILTPDRIMKAYDEELVSGSAKYNFDTEWSPLIDGLANGELFGKSINVYQIEDLISGKKQAKEHNNAIIMPYSMAQGIESGYHKKKGFIENPLAIARAGGIENLESYYEMAKNSNGDLSCYHRFSGRDGSVPLGRVLFLDVDYDGLSGYDDLSNDGRFVGVQGK
jgi:hypothetical protein